jgi:hypothetical protein
MSLLAQIQQYFTQALPKNPDGKKKKECDCVPANDQSHPEQSINRPSFFSLMWVAHQLYDGARIRITLPPRPQSHVSTFLTKHLNISLFPSFDFFLRFCSRMGYISSSSHASPVFISKGIVTPYYIC